MISGIVESWDFTNMKCGAHIVEVVVKGEGEGDVAMHTSDVKIIWMGDRTSGGSAQQHFDFSSIYLAA